MHIFNQHWGDGMWMGPWMMIAFIILFVAVVIMIVRVFIPNNRSSEPGYRSAKEILEERFAKGEIDEEEFLEKKKLL